MGTNPLVGHQDRACILQEVQNTEKRKEINGHLLQAQQGHFNAPTIYNKDGFSRREKIVYETNVDNYGNGSTKLSQKKPTKREVDLLQKQSGQQGAQPSERQMAINVER